MCFLTSVFSFFVIFPGVYVFFDVRIELFCDFPWVVCVSLRPNCVFCVIFPVFVVFFDVIIIILLFF